MKFDWIQTRSGEQFWPMKAEGKIDVRDIAFSLSKLCRFNGHCQKFYSVAEHSVLVSEMVASSDPAMARWGLLHDAAEAYLGDYPSPIKPSSIKKAELRLLDRIAEHFDLPPMPQEVMDADRRMLHIEAHTLMPECEEKWFKQPDGIELFTYRPECVLPDAALTMFMRRARELRLL